MMKQYAIVDDAGNVIRLEYSSEPPQGGHEVTPPVVGWPTQPGPGYTLTASGGALVWVNSLTLEDAQRLQWEAIKVERAKRIAGTFTSGGRVFQIDPTMITGASLAAKIALDAGVPWSMQWTLADDTREVLTAQEMIAAGLACGAAIDAIWNQSQDLRDHINAATTVEDVRAVIWPSG